VGVWKDTRAIGEHAEIERVFQPELPAARAAARLARWLQAVERAKGWEESVDSPAAPAP
jgi:glycerol kinase